MIITKLKGGLGNQLFQYAVGRRLAEDQKSELKFDISLLNQHNEITTLRKYKLHVFNLDIPIASVSDINRILGIKCLIPIKRRFWKMGIDLFRWNYIREIDYGYHPEVLKLKRDLILEGYWQSAKYFESIRSILLKELTLKNEFITTRFSTLRDEISQSNSVAIHVRRGDYVSNPTVTKEFGVCTLDYYLKSIEYMKQRLNNPRFYVFSDDLEWCKLSFKAENDIHFVAGFEDYQDLMLISSCQHQIISNSTFSWWGAWLNQNATKIVIAPKVWYIDPTFDTSHLIPLEWIRI